MREEVEKKALMWLGSLLQHLSEQGLIQAYTFYGDPVRIKYVDEKGKAWSVSVSNEELNNRDALSIARKLDGLEPGRLAEVLC